MNILHTADWHLGKKFHSQDRQEEHQLFLNWLLQIIQEQKIELLLIAGDIFDVSNPSNLARQMYYQFLRNIKNTSCQKVVIIGGNHDGILTLDAPKDLLEALDIYVVGGMREDISQEVIPIYIGKELKLVVCAVPYLRDADLRTSQMAESSQDRANLVRKGIISHYQQVYQLAKNYQKPIIGMGHLFATGMQKSESVRDIHVGNLGNVNVEDLPPFDYLALGHIHKPQFLGNNLMIRYSGSPLHLSFSEIEDEKEVCILSLENQKIQYLESLKIPDFRKLLRFKGTFEEVCENIKNNESVSKLKKWAEVQIEEQEADPTLVGRFEEFKESIKQLEIVKFSIRFQKNNSFTQDEMNVSLHDLQPIDVFKKKLGNQDEKHIETFNELLEIFYNQEL